MGVWWPPGAATPIPAGAAGSTPTCVHVQEGQLCGHVTGISMNGNGNGMVIGSGPAMTASGQLSVTGAVPWKGSVTGTCKRAGQEWSAVVKLGGGGQLGVSVRADGTVELALISGSSAFSGTVTQGGGTVSLARRSATFSGAPAGEVRVTGVLTC